MEKSAIKNDKIIRSVTNIVQKNNQQEGARSIALCKVKKQQ